MKKLLSIIMAAVMIITMTSIFTMSASAEPAASGTCGDNATWKIENNTLTITGTGAITGYHYNDLPWRGQAANIKKIVVGEGITDIGDGDFYYLDNLTEVSLPSTLKTIGNNAFGYNRKLSAVAIPYGVESIGERAFWATAITSIEVPDSVTQFGDAVFDNCFSLVTVSFSDNITKLGTNTCSACYELKNIKFPKNLKTVGKSAFAGCKKIETVELPDTVTSIGKSAFCLCSNLTAFVMPEGVKIGERAFEGTPKLDPTVITKQPKSKKAANKGDTVTLTIEATGNRLTYDWYYKNTGDKSFTKTTKHDATYEIDVTGARYGRKMYCVVVDRYRRELKSSTVTLTFDTKLTFTKQPVFDYATSGDTAKFTCAASGEGVKYRWYYRNADMKYPSCSSNDTRSYSIKMTDDRDGREMYCVATDKYGVSVMSDKVYMYLSKNITVTQQPVSTSAAVGQTAKISVDATGDGLSYKWYYRNPDMTRFAATSSTSKSYSIKMTEARDGREMFCLITDKYGNAIRTDIVKLSMNK